MLLGEYEHSVDLKGRIAVPAKFRPQLEAGLVVTRGFERCLQGYPLDAWRVLADRISSLSLGNADARRLRRHLFASAFDAELDKQGRILLPAPLRSYAGIGDGAVVAGMNTYFEIWSTQDWTATREELADDGTSIAEALADLGI